MSPCATLVTWKVALALDDQILMNGDEPAVMVIVVPFFVTPSAACAACGAANTPIDDNAMARSTARSDRAFDDRLTRGVGDPAARRGGGVFMIPLLCEWRRTACVVKAHRSTDRRY
jgi:hypothetical protein